MKSGGEILLIACYELGHQPLAVAWPAAFLERGGYRPAVMDLSVEPLDEDKVRAARVILISVPMHTALRLGTEVLARARALNPSAHIGLYGLYAALNAEYLRAHGADSVVGGESEGALVELVAGLDEHAVSAGVAATPIRRERLRFPVPSRHALPALAKYAQLERDGGRHLVGYVEASRGCRHRCRHCPIPPVYDGRFFVVDRAVVQADIRQAVAAGATHVTFGDPDFLNGPRHALAVARALHAEFPHVTFDFTAKVEHLLRRRADLPELAALGGLFVVSAVESLSNRVLAALDKGHTRADVIEALGVVRAAGMVLRPTWVAFTPWTTLDDYREMLDFIAREDLVDAVDPVQLGIRLLVPPGSLLIETDAMRPHLGDLVPGDFYYRWTHPDPRMDRLGEEVAAAVAAAARNDEDAWVTFDRVRRLADAAAGASGRPAAALPPADRRRPPRLTEPWFC
ncbi:MAG TPA: CUAEP/CCAEP-tail radical SAM protein [Methylomirabilota bacterium]|jgi:radical SAM superfamily enzyme YgiQ (UPF0313 family)